eukprot:5976051-Amphidinium_carterae.1
MVDIWHRWVSLPVLLGKVLSPSEGKPRIWNRSSLLCAPLGGCRLCYPVSTRSVLGHCHWQAIGTNIAIASGKR